MKTKGKFGCIFILASGVLFALDKYFTILSWSILTKPAIEKGYSYLNSPDMLNLKSNYFIKIFLVLGFIFILTDFFEYYKEKSFLNKNQNSN